MNKQYNQIKESNVKGRIALLIVFVGVLTAIGVNVIPNILFQEAEAMKTDQQCKKLEQKCEGGDINACREYERYC